jgi:hypothetical protein
MMPEDGLLRSYPSRQTEVLIETGLAFEKQQHKYFACRKIFLEQDYAHRFGSAGALYYGKSKPSPCELAHMEDSSFFRDQAKRCRHQAVGADLMLQITLETLAIDCIAYADELDYSDDYWFANRAQKDTESTEPRWSAMQKILVGILAIMTPGIFVLAALMH